MTVYALDDELHLFPDPAEAEPDGLLAVGGDLSISRLLTAYSLGIFPWYSRESPILWWSPSPRLLLFPSEVHVPRRLARLLRKGTFRFSVDTRFRDVIKACAAQPRPGQHGTWIVPDMVRAYIDLHEVGAAHSVEVWCREEGGWRLAGGLYGVGLGSAFFGESMFYHVPNASKAAVVVLSRLLLHWKAAFIDCQQTTRHMLRFGAREVGREEFLSRLALALGPDSPHPLFGQWSMPESLELVKGVPLGPLLLESGRGRIGPVWCETVNQGEPEEA